MSDVARAMSRAELVRSAAALAGAGPDEVVRAEPFEALELAVGALFGRDVEP